MGDGCNRKKQVPALGDTGSMEQPDMAITISIGISVSSSLINKRETFIRGYLDLSKANRIAIYHWEGWKDWKNPDPKTGVPVLYNLQCAKL